MTNEEWRRLYWDEELIKWTERSVDMAKYDFGGGCPCGLNKVCDCGHVKSSGLNEKGDAFLEKIYQDDKKYGVLETANFDKKIAYKYCEDKIVADLKAHLDKTYGKHYNTDDEIQCFDAWIALGDSADTFRNTALKYLWRYGKKSGKNKADLMKAFHYIVMILYVDHYKEEKEKNN